MSLQDAGRSRLDFTPSPTSSSRTAAARCAAKSSSSPLSQCPSIRTTMSFSASNHEAIAIAIDRVSDISLALEGSKKSPGRVPGAAFLISAARGPAEETTSSWMGKGAVQRPKPWEEPQAFTRSRSGEQPLQSTRDRNTSRLRLRSSPSCSSTSWWPSRISLRRPLCSDKICTIWGKICSPPTIWLESLSKQRRNRPNSRSV
mmetsp:Transcript_97655/g.217938  ORF Transcript_97655/g.217938 Transcript_97655/m.217938 type:complete len:202 (-) Transcript_97655:1171-1776(-)